MAAFVSTFEAEGDGVSTVTNVSVTIPVASSRIATLKVCMRGSDANTEITEAKLDGVDFDLDFDGSPVRVWNGFQAAECGWMADDDMPSGTVTLSVTRSGSSDGMVAILTFFDEALQEAPIFDTVGYDSSPPDPVSLTLTMPDSGVLDDVICSPSGTFAVDETGQVERNDINVGGASMHAWSSTRPATSSGSWDSSWDVGGTGSRIEYILMGIPDVGGGALVVQDLNQSMALESPTLTQHNVLVTNDVSQLQLLGIPTLTPDLVVDGLDQTQLLDEPTLTQHNVLSTDGLNQSQLIDSPLLTQHHILTVDDLNQAQELENVTLTALNALVVQGLDQGQTIDNVTLTVLGALVVQGLEQSQLLDAPTLIQQNILAVDGLTQSQLLDNVTLTVQSFSLLVDGLTQSQELGTPSLTQANVLSVNGLTQSQLLSVVTLGGLVVGYLEGELSVFSAYNNSLKVTNALTGEFSIFP